MHVSGIRRFRLGTRLGVALTAFVTMDVCNSSAVLAQALEPETAEAGDASLGDEIIVTARHQEETLLTAPESITALGERTLAVLNIRSFGDYATKIPSLSFAYGTAALGYGGSRSIAIRGISGAGTTAFYIDDTPIPATVDPQVVDIQRVEVLKGPRGTLYGEGSLGGNLRMITNQPRLNEDEFKVSADFGFTDGGGSPNYAFNAIGNVPLVDDRVALRLVGFASHSAGFVTRTFPDQLDPVRLDSEDDQGSLETFGGSASLLLQLSDNLTATARVMAQTSENSGLRVAYAPLPAFEPLSYTSDRSNNVEEYSNESWYLPSLELNYETDVANITSSTSFFKRRTRDQEDGTEGTTSALVFFYGLPASLGENGFPWSLHSEQERFNQEVRASFAGNDWISGVIGGRYATASGDGTIDPFIIPGLQDTGFWPNDLGWFNTAHNSSRDISFFGEAYLNYSGFELTLGLRQFWLRQSSNLIADGLLNGGLTDNPTTQSRASDLNPRASLSYNINDDGLVYVSASKGFRAGRSNGSLPSICDPGLAQIGVSRDELNEVKPDSVWNYEVGAKAAISRLNFTVAAFQMDWTDIQQSLTVPVCFITTGTNAGSARVRGLEFEVLGELAPGLSIRAGLGYNDAKITEEGVSGQPVGSRVYQVPKITGSLAATYTQPLSDNVDGYISADYSYNGNSLSATTRFAGGTLVRPSYSLFNARLGVDIDDVSIGVYARNLFNSRGNLGDINPISYVRIDSNGNNLPRVALLEPLQLGVQFRYGF